MTRIEVGDVNNHHSEFNALKQLRAELDRLPDDELMQQNVVAIDALTTVRGVLRELMELRPLMQQLLNFNIEHIDRLELYAMAFAGAQAQYQILKEHSKEPAAIMREGLTLRSRLVTDLKVLVRRGIVAPESLQKLRNRTSYTKVAADLLFLAALLHNHSSVLTGKCAITAEEIARAEALADKLTVVASLRLKPLETEAEALKLRQRAFTVFSRAYSQVRRAVQYLRYAEGDADRFAPPLTGKRKRGKQSHAKTDAAQLDETSVLGKAQEQDNPSTLTQPTPALASASAATVTIEETAPNSMLETGVGLPGSNPFLH